MSSSGKPWYVTVAFAIAALFLAGLVCIVLFIVVQVFRVQEPRVSTVYEFEEEEFADTSEMAEPIQSLYGLVDLSELDELSGKLDVTDWYRVDLTAAEVKIPENVSEKLAARMQRYLTKPAAKVAMRFSNKKLPGSMAMDMSAAGDLIYVIDKDNKITLVDVETQKVKSRFDSPIPGSFGILVDVSQKTLYVANPTHLAKVSLATNEQEGNLIELPKQMVNWQRAKASNQIAGVSEDGLLMVIDPDQDKVYRLENTKVGTQVSVHPDGKYALAYDDKNLLRWHHLEEPARLERLECTNFDLSYVPSISDADADRWFNSMGMQQWNGENHFRWMSTYSVPYLTMFLSLRTTAVASSQGFDGSMVSVIGQVRNQDKAFPVMLASFQFSGKSVFQTQMLPIDADVVAQMKLDQTGNRIAILTEDELQVIDRTSVEDMLGMFTPSSMSKSLYTGEIDQALDFVNQVRSRDWPDRLITGEGFYGRFLERLATEYIYAEKNPTVEENIQAKQAFDELVEEGNEAAKVASAIKQIAIGLEARGSGWASDVSPGDWQIFGQRIQQADRELDAICAMEKPPAAALYWKVDTMLHCGASLQDCVPYVRRFMELYPRELTIHHKMCQWLLPRWGGAPGAVNLYVTKIASLYPKPIQDQVYASILLELIDTYCNAWIYEPNEANADIDRVYLGALELRDKGQLIPSHYEALLAMAMELPSEDMVEDFADHFLGKYMACSWTAHQNLARDALAIRKYHYMIAPDRRQPFKIPEQMVKRR